MSPTYFKSLIAFLLIVTSVFVSSTASACLGVKRTIHVSKFNPALGTGSGGHIGLRNKEVVLTFDDGPLPGKTTRILTALSRECTKATFFVVGKMARAYPGTLRKIARSGHTIAHHTHTHANLRGNSLASAQREIQRGIAATRLALGPLKNRSSKLFRYPYLARNASLDRIVRQNGLIPFSASIMSLDWKSGSSSAVVARVMDQLAKRGRGVILMHDIQGRTATALPSLLKKLKSGGYKIVHIRSGGSGRAKGVNIASLKPAKVSKKKSTKRRVAKRVKRKKIDRTTTGTTRRKANSSRKFSLFGTSSSKSTKAYAPSKHAARLERMKKDSLRRSKLLTKKNREAAKKKRKASRQASLKKRKTSKRTKRKSQSVTR